MTGTHVSVGLGDGIACEGGLGGGVVVLEGSALGVDVSGVLLPGGEGGVGGSSAALICSACSPAYEPKNSISPLMAAILALASSLAAAAASRSAAAWAKIAWNLAKPSAICLRRSSSACFFFKAPISPLIMV